MRHLLDEDVANLGAVSVNGRNQNVGGTVMAQLHNQFREVGFAG